MDDVSGIYIKQFVSLDNFIEVVIRGYLLMVKFFQRANMF